jgi:hypothetical protein
MATLAELVDSMRRAEREGKLGDKVRYLSRYSLLIVDEIGYLPVGSGGGNLFFQLVNACYERSAMIMTRNRGFGEWADIFGDSVVATALLDRLLHHAVVIPIEGNSYRLREHADLIPEHLRARSLRETTPVVELKRRPVGHERRLQRHSPAEHRKPPWVGNLLRRKNGEKYSGVDRDTCCVARDAAPTGSPTTRAATAIARSVRPVPHDAGFRRARPICCPSSTTTWSSRCRRRSPTSPIRTRR